MQAFDGLKNLRDHFFEARQLAFEFTVHRPF